MRNTPLRAFAKSSPMKTGEKSMEGFMNPPYKDPKSKGPREDRKDLAYHGYKSKEPESYGAGHNKVFRDGPKKRMHFHKKK